MKHQIKQCYSGRVVFKARCESLSGCVELAVKQGADLTYADLTGADLADADLTGASLYCADLTGASLYCADLTRADLTGANLTSASLTRADLTRANLYSANLKCVSFTGANLAYANFTRANLAGADYGAGVPMTRPPVFIYGLMYRLYILDQHIRIGCELHTTDEWASFSNDCIAEMDGKAALRFWREHKGAILTLARSHQKEGATS